MKLRRSFCVFCMSAAIPLGFGNRQAGARRPLGLLEGAIFTVTVVSRRVAPRALRR
jgi:hypothetical protein